MIRILLIALAVAGCAPMASPSSGTAEPLAITYDSGQCFGSCPIYTVTVRSDGTGVFTGNRFTAVSGTREFTLAPAQFRAFAERLAPYRPTGELDIRPGTALCRNAATDQASVDITWSKGKRRDNLHFYYGCGLHDRTRSEALRRAPEALPIADMIGPREPFQGQR